MFHKYIHLHRLLTHTLAGLPLSDVVLLLGKAQLSQRLVRIACGVAVVVVSLERELACVVEVSEALGHHHH